VAHLSWGIYREWFRLGVVFGRGLGVVECHGGIVVAGEGWMRERGEAISGRAGGVEGVWQAELGCLVSCPFRFGVAGAEVVL